MFILAILKYRWICVCLSGACRARVIQPESTHRDLLNYANVRADSALYVCVCVCVSASSYKIVKCLPHLLPFPHTRTNMHFRDFMELTSLWQLQGCVRGCVCDKSPRQNYSWHLCNISLCLVSLFWSQLFCLHLSLIHLSTSFSFSLTSQPSSLHSVVLFSFLFLTCFQAVLLRPPIYPEGFVVNTPVCYSHYSRSPSCLNSSIHLSLFCSVIPLWTLLPAVSLFPSLTSSPLNLVFLPLASSSLPPSSQLIFFYQFNAWQPNILHFISFLLSKYCSCFSFQSTSCSFLMLLSFIYLCSSWIKLFFIYMTWLGSSGAMTTEKSASISENYMITTGLLLHLLKGKSAECLNVFKMQAVCLRIRSYHVFQLCEQNAIARFDCFSVSWYWGFLMILKTMNATLSRNNPHSHIWG